MADFRTIIFTLPEPPACGNSGEVEAAAITGYLSTGAADRVHLRHPGLSAEAMRTILRAIPAKLYPRITIHDKFELAAEFPGLGLHLNSRCHTVPAGFDGTLSASLHDPAQVTALADGSEQYGIEPWRYSYFTLSPIFKSISKPGYDNTVTVTPALRSAMLKISVVALGGCTPDKFPELSRNNFCGAAMLGYAWPQNHANAANDVQPDAKFLEGDYQTVIRGIAAGRRACRLTGFHLQFITDSKTIDGTEAQARQALDGGCRWIQVRMKDAPVDTVRHALMRVAPFCAEHRATLIVDDHVTLAALPGVDGVHLGQTDMTVAEARRILPTDRIIGLTVNNMDHARKVFSPDIDYIGMGPWRFTTTKRNLAPVLGPDGIREIITFLRQNNCHVPVVAIGGLTPADAAQLPYSLADGMAVSGAISGAPDPIQATGEFLRAINIKHYIND